LPIFPHPTSSNHAFTITLLGMPNQELGHTTAEKQKPSPLQFLADFRNAINIEKRLAKAGSKTNLKDLLAKVVAEYNRLCTVKHHRVDTHRRQLIYNMFQGYF